MTKATELEHYHHFQKTRVEINGFQTPGRVSHTFDVPRSYVVETASGQVRRSRSHLRTHSEDEQAVVPAEPVVGTARPVTWSQTETVVYPPDHLRY